MKWFGLLVALTIGMGLLVGVHVVTPGTDTDADAPRFPWIGRAISPARDRRGTAMQGSKRDIIAVMVENSAEARPHHKGLGSALFVGEFTVEGGITRFVVLFDRDMLPRTIGPVRSLRLYFSHAIAPWVCCLLFAGGSPEALTGIHSLANVTSRNGLAWPGYFRRDPSIAMPHNLFWRIDLSAAFLKDLPRRPIPWPPYTIGPAVSGVTASTVRLNYFSSAHNVSYTFEEGKGTYARLNGRVTSELHPANVLVLEAPSTGVGEKGRLTIPLVSGKAILFRDGSMQEAIWTKADTVSPFVFTMPNGVPLPFAKGATWMTVLPSLERVTWE